MLLSKARLSASKKFKTIVKLTFHIKLRDIDEKLLLQLMQAEKIHGFLAFNPDEFKKEVEDVMKNISIGIDETGHSRSQVERGILLQIWNKSDSYKSFKEFYQDKKNKDIEKLKKYYQEMNA